MGETVRGTEQSRWERIKKMRKTFFIRQSRPIPANQPPGTLSAHPQGWNEVEEVAVWRTGAILRT
jgi:hypothetical protein